MIDNRTGRSAGTATPAGMPAELWLVQEEATAAFTPSEGLWNTAFRVLHDRQWVPLLAEPPSWELLRGRPAMVGDCILFPFAYGVREGRFRFHGQNFVLAPPREGHVIHGLARDFGWAVLDTWSGPDESGLRAAFDHYVPNPGDAAGAARLAQFPFPFRLVATRRLRGKALALELEATNTGETAMPMAPGIHPYLSHPLFPDGNDADCVVSSTASYYGGMHWGQRPSDTPQEGPLDIRQGRRLDEYLAAGGPADRGLLIPHAEIPHGQTVKSGDTPGTQWSLRDERKGLTVEITSSAAFQYNLDFTPPDRRILSPVFSTCTPMAFELLNEGIESAVLELAPGETWNAWVTIEARAD